MIIYRYKKKCSKYFWNILTRNYFYIVLIKSKKDRKNKNRVVPSIDDGSSQDADEQLHALRTPPESVARERYFVRRVERYRFPPCPSSATIYTRKFSPKKEFEKGLKRWFRIFRYRRTDLGNFFVRVLSELERPLLARR